VATGSETAGLIRRRRRRAAIGCGLCSQCQSVRTLPPPRPLVTLVVQRFIHFFHVLRSTYMGWRWPGILVPYQPRWKSLFTREW